MTPPKQISVLLVEDHAIVRKGLRALLQADGQFTIAGEAQNGREGVELARRLRPDVILMDIAMPVLNGLDAARQILAANPAAKVIMLSAHSDDAYIERANATGVAGFLAKQTSADILAGAIREVAEGRKFFSPSIAKRMPPDRQNPRDRHGELLAKGAGLTGRESKVLRLVAGGSANRQVAETLGITIPAVESHLRVLMDKLKIHETAGLIRWSVAAGLIENSVQLTII
jgi:DNA-binding NarL/FixJ family response regulator